MDSNIKDITGKTIIVTDIDKAIEQCEMCSNNKYILKSGHTVGENHIFMLKQILALKRSLNTKSKK